MLVQLNDIIYMLVLKSVSKTLTILTPCCGNMYEEAGRKVVGGAVVLLSLSTRNRVKSGLQRQGTIHI